MRPIGFGASMIRMSKKISEMTPLEKHRAGLPITLSDKLRQVASLSELQGFVDQITKDRREVTREEWELIAGMKVEFLRQIQARSSRR